jgi:hypothetical protein
MTALRRYTKEELALLAVAAGVSLLFSALAVYQDDVINSDGVIYIEAAKAFATTDASQVFTIYRWPFYPWLIFLLDAASGIGLENAAHLLNALFSALLVVCFVALVKEMGGTFRVLVAAALIILAYTRLNEYRSFVIRDIGYWSFYLLALLLFIRYFREPRGSRAAAWTSAMVVATLFRIEGIVFLALLPLSLLFRRDLTWGRRVKQIALAYVPHALLLALLLSFFALTDWRETGRLLEPLALAERRAEIAEAFRTKAAALSEAILNRYSSHLAATALVSALAGILLMSLVKAISLLYSALSLHAYVSRSIHMQREALVIIAYSAAINVVVLAVYLLTNFFLTGRFGVALALVVFLAAPFSLALLYERWRVSEGPRWVFPIVCVAILYMLVDGFVSTGGSNRYVKDAGLWLRENAPAGARVYIDEFRVLFYAARDNAVFPEEGWEQTRRIVESDRWKKYDYLALEVERRNDEREAWLTERIGPPVARFGNERNDKILIFKNDRRQQ